jgi:hypothetical protein
MEEAHLKKKKEKRFRGDSETPAETPQQSNVTKCFRGDLETPAETFATAKCNERQA